MEDYPIRRGECQETSGFLFSHQCGEFATKQCEKCGKEICSRHTVQGPDLLCCTTCGKDERKPPPGPPGGRHYDPYYDDPYFYTDYHYPNYRKDRNNFTDSDEAAIRGGAIAASELGVFEDDMGAS